MRFLTQAGSSGGSITPAADTHEFGPATRFGAVMAHEHDLQTSTDAEIGMLNDHQSKGIDRLLRNHYLQIDHNIALLEQGYETRPPATWISRRGSERIARTGRAPVAGEPENAARLPELVAQHVRMLGDIERLMAGRAAAQPGDLILREVARSHQEMAGMLTALIKEEEMVRDLEPQPIFAGGRLSRGEEIWENEGGASNVPAA